MKRDNKNLTGLLLGACALWACSALAQDYHFDGSISKEVLENYLDRSVSFTELLHDDLSVARNSHGVDPKDNLRFILNTKAKFVGRALMCWGRERELDTLCHNAKIFADRIHQADPDIVLQGAAFEIVTRGVESVAIPEYVFKEFDQPVTNRHFVFADIGFTNGNRRTMGNGNIPDMSRLEARMWFYYLVTKYIDAGIEAVHFGQVGLMDQNDRHHVGWIDMLTRVRTYAHQHARRHFLICDAHTPRGGFVEDGHLLFDAHAFPLRIDEGDAPLKGVLEVGHSDSLFKKSMGGITPSGWSCEHLPYLVEFDNFGGRNQGSSSKGTIFIWGYDEITWFSVLPEAERNAWLRYAWNWLKETDPAGHLEMPGSRTISLGRGGAAAPAASATTTNAAGTTTNAAATLGRGRGGGRWYSANTRSDACPSGSNTEETIKEIWAADTHK
jgi:hypothetical protein